MGKTSPILTLGLKTLLRSVLLLSITAPLVADIPAGYYTSASGKSGTTLKSALNDIIDGHTEYPYTSTGTDVWDILKISDRDPNNASNVICVYTQYSVNAAQEYNSGAGWSREHVWAKSHGDFGTSTGTGTDLHNLKPEDVSVNSTRNNKDFEEGGTPVTDDSPPSGYSGTLDCYTTSTTFEPPDAVKGDVARIIFYMVTRYEGENGEVDLEMVDYADSAPNLEPLHGVESTLLAWHAADPVDDFERNRNDVIYSYQGNRNPFIDHPEYVDYIWNGTIPPPTNLLASNVAETSLNLSWEDNMEDESGFYLYRDNTKIETLNANSTTTTVSGLNSGTTYSFKVSTYRTTTESSKVSLDVTTGGTSGSGSSGDLLITAAYDGPITGGLPKGIELYVINNISDLSDYGIGSANNGGGTDGEEFTFPAVAASAGDFIYVASETPEFTNWFGSAPDYTTSSMIINGDDAIELFHNGSVIDVYGDIHVDGSGQSWDYLDGWAYSKDDRNPSSTFNSGDWTYSGINALDGETTNAAASNAVPVGTYSRNDSSLPVALSAWTASSSQGQVKLTWTTGSEIENQGFIIEKSQHSGVSSQEAWQELASFATHSSLLGQGSTSSQSVYSFVDSDVKVGETYTYRLSDVDYRGNVTTHHEIRVTVRDAEPDLKPGEVSLHAAYPNPFNPLVNLSFTLESETANIALQIYDIKGAYIHTLTDGRHAAGTHFYHWKGQDDRGIPVASGIYLVRLTAPSGVQIQRVTLLR